MTTNGNGPSEHPDAAADERPLLAIPSERPTRPELRASGNWEYIARELANVIFRMEDRFQRSEQHDREMHARMELFAAELARVPKRGEQ